MKAAPYAAIATFVGSLVWSVASAEPIRRELIAPRIDSALGRLASYALEPPARWPPSDRVATPVPPPHCPATTARKRKRPRTLVGKLNLNLATAEQLQMLPGVGPRKAELIVRARTRRGPFRRVLDLRRVRGFGRRSVARLRRYLTIEGPSTLRMQETSD